MIDEGLVQAHRARALSPDHPVIRGTAQNPDVYFQAREASNPFYAACPAIMQKAMEQYVMSRAATENMTDEGVPTRCHR